MGAVAATPADPPTRALARLVRAYPLTLGVALLGTLVFAAQVAEPAVVGALRRSPDRRTRPAARGLGALVVTAAVVMAASGDAHGVGLRTGLGLTALPLMRPPPAAQSPASPNT